MQLQVERHTIKIHSVRKRENRNTHTQIVTERERGEKHTQDPLWTFPGSQDCAQAHRGIGRIGSTWFLCKQSMHTHTHTIYRRQHTTHIQHTCTGLPTHKLCQTPVTPTQRLLLDGGSVSQRKFSLNCHRALTAAGATFSQQMGV